MPACAPCCAPRSSAYARLSPPATKLQLPKYSRNPRASLIAWPTRTSSTKTRLLVIKAVLPPQSKQSPDTARKGWIGKILSGLSPEQKRTLTASFFCCCGIVHSDDSPLLLKPYGETSLK